jgi:hypothetical protein
MIQIITKNLYIDQKQVSNLKKCHAQFAIVLMDFATKGQRTIVSSL